MPELWVLDGTWDSIDEWDVIDEKNLNIACQIPSDWTFTVFADGMEAFHANGSPDAIVADIGTLSGPYPQPEHAHFIIESIMEKHSGAILFVTSAVGGWADDVVSQLEEIGLKPIPLCSEYDTWRETFIEYGLFKEEE